MITLVKCLTCTKVHVQQVIQVFEERQKLVNIHETEITNQSVKPVAEIDLFPFTHFDWKNYYAWKPNTQNKSRVKLFRSCWGKIKDFRMIFITHKRIQRELRGPQTCTKWWLYKLLQNKTPILQQENGQCTTRTSEDRSCYSYRYLLHCGKILSSSPNRSRYEYVPCPCLIAAECDSQVIFYISDHTSRSSWLPCEWPPYNTNMFPVFLFISMSKRVLDAPNMNQFGKPQLRYLATTASLSPCRGGVDKSQGRGWVICVCVWGVTSQRGSGPLVGEGWHFPGEGATPWPVMGRGWDASKGLVEPEPWSVPIPLRAFFKCSESEQGIKQNVFAYLLERNSAETPLCTESLLLVPDKKK